MNDSQQKLLIVDDNNDHLQVFGRIAQHHGYQPILCPSIAASLDVLNREDYYIALVDISTILGPSQEVDKSLLRKLRDRGVRVGLMTSGVGKDVSELGVPLFFKIELQNSREFTLAIRDINEWGERGRPIEGRTASR